MFKLCLLIAIVGVSFASVAWDDLRVTWDPKFWEAGAFAKLPRTEDDAKKAGFVLKDDQCTSVQQTFRGKRYWINQDPAVVLLYDKNGFIAGIQNSPKASEYTPATPQIGPILKDGDYWTLTAYFVDPKIICATGRTQAQFDQEGTGTDLKLQVGANPEKDLTVIPHKESDIKTSSLWGNGKCLPSMGQHYWFNVTKDMNCDNFFPYCVLYNGGHLNAFCFAVDHDLTYSTRYEHPNTKQARGCCLNTPDCFDTDPRHLQPQSTMHVYLTSTPWENLCII
jgi:charged multivesicular body protein 7